MHDLSLFQAVFGSLAIFTGCTIAAMGGIGGGGVNVPLLVAIFGFEFKEAAVLSLCVVLGSVSVQFYLNRNSSHPDCPTRPLPYWDFIIVYLPGQLMGSTAGIFARDIIPQAVIESVAVMVLSIVATKTMLKGFRTFKSESIVIERKANSELIRDPAILAGLIADESDKLFGSDLELSSEVSFDGPPGSRLVQPWKSIAALVGTGIVYTVIFATTTFVPKCSVAHISLLFTVFAPMAALEMWSAGYVVRKQKENPCDVVKGDLNWDKVSDERKKEGKKNEPLPAQ
jgi:uncharacterized membrane protein YfcA